MMATPENVTLPHEMSDDVVQRMEIAIFAIKDHNPLAGLVYLALQKTTTLDQKRGILKTSYAQGYELLTMMTMAVNSSVKPDEVQRRLDRNK